MEHILEYFRLKQAFEALQEIEGENQEQDDEQQSIHYPTRTSLLQRTFDALRWLLKWTPVKNQ